MPRESRRSERIESYPEALVSAMEKHGFIWGGKWAHFDFLHFEYRPEIIIKARGRQKFGEEWYSGFRRTRARLRWYAASTRRSDEEAEMAAVSRRAYPAKTIKLKADTAQI